MATAVARSETSALAVSLSTMICLLTPGPAVKISANMLTDAAGSDMYLSDAYTSVGGEIGDDGDINDFLRGEGVTRA